MAIWFKMPVLFPEQTAAFRQVSLTGQQASQNPCSGHFECNGDFATTTESAPGAEHTTISFAVAAWLSTNALPFGTERKGITVIGSSLQETSRYGLSYTEVLLNFLPCGSVPLAVAVRVLPSADTTTRPVIVTFSPFLIVNSNV